MKNLIAIALMAPILALAQSFPATVNLGTAGNYVLLAKTGISTTGTTSITGDLGISPAAASFITGFGLIADATNVFSTSSLVTGKIYAANYAAPTPSNMTTAIGDMQTAYTNAAGRKLPDHSELGTGNVTGMTLTHGLYNWSTGVSVAAGGVTISGSPTDIWIFQVAGDLTLANGAAVTLSGGALASNIFWQVGGQVNLGTTAAMKGVILCQTQIAMNTGASLTGSALAQTAITLNANAITKSSPVTTIRNVSSSQKFTLFLNPLTKNIEFTVPANGKTALRILDPLGRNVATLFNGNAEAGKHNAIPFNTAGLSKGLYFSTLEFNGRVLMNKMLVL